MEKIKIVGLQKSYTNRKKESTVALYKCDLLVYPGEFLVLLGESGCGKTSLLKVIAGIESYDFGDIYFDGIKAEELTQLEKNMSYVSQNIVLFPHKTVFENIMQPLNILKVPKKDKLERIKELGEKLGISILLTRRPRELSGGQQQRVAIARAIAKEPAICLFDEPLSALDPVYHDEIIEFLLYTHKLTQATYIYSTHNQKEAFRLADRVAIMHNRKIEQIDRPSEVIKHPKTLFVSKFLKDIFVLHIPCIYQNGRIINEELGINAIGNIDKKYVKKIEGKNIVVALKTNNIILSENGEYTLDLISSSSSSLEVRFNEQNFILPNPELKEFNDYVKVNFNFNDVTIFLEGKNIENEDI